MSNKFASLVEKNASIKLVKAKPFLPLLNISFCFIKKLSELLFKRKYDIRAKTNLSNFKHYLSVVILNWLKKNLTMIPY